MLSASRKIGYLMKETFNFDEWWATVNIEDKSSKELLKQWLRDESVISRNALMELDFHHFRANVKVGWKLEVLDAIKRLSEFSNRNFYQASLILNAAFFFISV